MLTFGFLPCKQVENLEAIRSDLLTALLPTLEGKLDVIIFNPPYVPTEDDEVAMDGIEASYAGGERGRRVIDRFMPMMHVRLQDRPRASASIALAYDTAQRACVLN
jgi:methylase of polypeptide subunit release factors